jgi:hypothetical protein
VLQTDPAVHDKKKRSDHPAAVQLFSPEWTSGSDDVAAAKTPWPSGNQASKRRVEEEKIIENTASTLKEGLPTGSTGTVGAKAISDFSSVLSSMFNQWQECNKFQNVDPSLRNSYEELLIKQKIYEMEHLQKSREGVHEQQLQQNQQWIEEEQRNEQQQIQQEEE